MNMVDTLRFVHPTLHPSTVAGFYPAIWRGYEKSVITSDNSAVKSTLRIESETFIPFSLRETSIDSTKIVGPEFFKPSSPQNLRNSASMLRESFETQLCTDEPIEQSRLFRFWLKTNNQDVDGHEHGSTNQI
jgi:hypothetical protein